MITNTTPNHVQPIRKPENWNAPEPIIVPTAVPHVWKVTENGRFVWSDETSALSSTSYATIEEAFDALTVYKWFVIEGVGERLKSGVLNITFTKSDGTVRTMRCTAQPSAFPVRDASEVSKSPNPNVQVVWDLDKQAVRSFRKASVIGYTE